MTDRRRLRTAVLARDPEGVFSVLGVGELVPEWADLPDDVLGPIEQEPDEVDEETEEVDEETEDAPAASEDAAQSGEDEEPNTESEEDLIGAENAPEGQSDLEQPSSNGSLVDWQAYALSTGATQEDIDGKSRNELRATYGA